MNVGIITSFRAECRRALPSSRGRARFASAGRCIAVSVSASLAGAVGGLTAAGAGGEGLVAAVVGAGADGWVTAARGARMPTGAAAGRGATASTRAGGVAPRAAMTPPDSPTTTAIVRAMARLRRSGRHDHNTALKRPVAANRPAAARRARTIAGNACRRT